MRRRPVFACDPARQFDLQENGRTAQLGDRRSVLLGAAAAEAGARAAAAAGAGGRRVQPRHRRVRPEDEQKLNAGSGTVRAGHPRYRPIAHQSVSPARNGKPPEPVPPEPHRAGRGKVPVPLVEATTSGAGRAPGRH